MRHRKRRRPLGRKGSERKAMLENMATSLLIHQRIETTVPKAKEARRLAEKLITLGKNPTIHSRRRAYDILQDRDLVKLLFADIAPLFKDRSGGYTRIIHSRNRMGDGAEMAILELTEFREGKIAKTRPEQDKKEKVKETKEKGTRSQEEKQPNPAEKKSVEAPKPVVKEESQIATPAAEEQQPIKKEAPKEENKGFLGGLRKAFGKKK